MLVGFQGQANCCGPAAPRPDHHEINDLTRVQNFFMSVTSVVVAKGRA